MITAVHPRIEGEQPFLKLPVRIYRLILGFLSLSDGKSLRLVQKNLAFIVLSIKAQEEAQLLLRVQKTLSFSLNFLPIRMREKIDSFKIQAGKKDSLTWQSIATQNQQFCSHVVGAFFHFSPQIFSFIDPLAPRNLESFFELMHPCVYKVRKYTVSPRAPLPLHLGGDRVVQEIEYDREGGRPFSIPEEERAHWALRYFSLHVIYRTPPQDIQSALIEEEGRDAFFAALFDQQIIKPNNTVNKLISTAHYVKERKFREGLYKTTAEVLEREVHNWVEFIRALFANRLLTPQGESDFINLLMERDISYAVAQAATIQSLWVKKRVAFQFFRKLPEILLAGEDACRKFFLFMLALPEGLKQGAFLPAWEIIEMIGVFLHDPTQINLFLPRMQRELQGQREGEDRLRMVIQHVLTHYVRYRASQLEIYPKVWRLAAHFQLSGAMATFTLQGVICIQKEETIMEVLRAFFQRGRRENYLHFLHRLIEHSALVSKRLYDAEAAWEMIDRSISNQPDRAWVEGVLQQKIEGLKRDRSPEVGVGKAMFRLMQKFCSDQKKRKEWAEVVFSRLNDNLSRSQNRNESLRELCRIFQEEKERSIKIGMIRLLGWDDLLTALGWGMISFEEMIEVAQIEEDAQKREEYFYLAGVGLTKFYIYKAFPFKEFWKRYQEQVAIYPGMLERVLPELANYSDLLIGEKVISVREGVLLANRIKEKEAKQAMLRQIVSQCKILIEIGSKEEILGALEEIKEEALQEGIEQLKTTIREGTNR